MIDDDRSIEAGAPSAPANRPMEDVIKELRKLSRDELIAKYREVYGREPKQTNREWLWKRIAWSEQENRLGGLSNVAKARLEALIAQIELPPLEAKRTVTGRLRKPKKPKALAVGTVLTREYQGKTLAVTVVAGGEFEFQGERYRSLTAVAFKATGSHWNGRLFFNLTGRSRGRKR